MIKLKYSKKKILKKFLNDLVKSHILNKVLSKTKDNKDRDKKNFYIN